MKVLQGAPKFQGGPGPQQGSPMFPGQYPAPYSPVQASEGGMSDMLNAIMPLIILMMMMGMMMPMMKGMTGQST